MTFKVLAGYGDRRGGPKCIPWSEAEKFRAQAQQNHGIEGKAKAEEVQECAK